MNRVHTAGFKWLRIESVAGCCEHDNENLGFIKDGIFLDQLSENQFLEDPVPFYRDMET
jgi:hypothetical protein